MRKSPAAQTKAMTKHPLILAHILLICSALLLNACGPSSGGYSRAPSRAPAASAQQAPNQLDEANDLSQQQTAPANLPTVKVGLLLPLSGQHKGLGDAMLKSAQLALFEIGHANLELLPRDTMGTAEGARSAAQSAVNDGAQILLGPVFAPAVKAAKPIAQRSRINMLAFSTDWSLAGGNTYIMGFLPFDQVERVTRYAASNGMSRVGVISPASAYGSVVTNAFNKAASQSGVSIVQNKTYPPGTGNLAPVVREFTNFDARSSTGNLSTSPFDAVFMPVGGQDARAIGSLLTHYELPPRNVKRLGTGLLDEAALASEANLEGAWFAAPPPQARRGFEDRFVRTFGSRPPRLSTLSYDATALVAVLAQRGLQQSGRPAFSSSDLHNPNGFSGVDGIFRFRRGNTIERGLAIVEFRRGQLVVADPAPTTFQSLSQ